MFDLFSVRQSRHPKKWRSAWLCSHTIWNFVNLTMHDRKRIVVQIHLRWAILLTICHVHFSILHVHFVCRYSLYQYLRLIYSRNLTAHQSIRRKWNSTILHKRDQSQNYNRTYCMRMRRRNLPISTTLKPVTVNDFNNFLFDSLTVNVSAAWSIRCLISSGTRVGIPKLKVATIKIMINFVNLFWASVMDNGHETTYV